MGHRSRRWTGGAPLAAFALPTLLALGLTLTACTSSSNTNKDGLADAGNAGVVDATGPPQAGGRVVYGLSAESQGWNPTTTTWDSSGLEVSRALFDTLTALDDNLTVQPNLAEAVTPNADNTSWTITVRPNVQLRNGRTVDAGVVAEDLQVMKDAPLTAPGLEPITGITASDGHDVVVTMSRPWADFPYALTTQLGVVADPGWLRSGNPSDPIGTGPFTFGQWTPHQSLTVERNAAYWRSDSQGLRLPYLDEVVFRPIPDPGSRSAAFEAGDLDLMQTSSADQLDHFRHLGKDGTYQVFADPLGETAETFVELNTAAPPFDDLTARLALVAATDTKTYAQEVGEDLVDPATGPFATNSPWYRATSYPEYDTHRAKQLVDEVKATHGGTFGFTLIGPADPASLPGLRLLQAQWKAMGIEVQIEPVPPSDLGDQLAVGAYQAALWSQFDAPSPAGDALAWHPATAQPIGQAALNATRNQDAEIGQALEEARSTTDPAREKDLYGIVQDRLAADVPYVWLFHSTVGVVASDQLVSVVDYTLPGGQPGLELIRNTHPLSQIWRTS